MGTSRFRTWLRNQASRDDPVGDLARDAGQDDRSWSASPGRLRSRMRQLGASDAALDALDRAEREWKMYSQAESTIQAGRSAGSDREMIQMGTFAQWVKQQEDRQDGIGYFARYWASVTPGKISSVDGIARHLGKIEKSYADTGDERGKAAIGAARTGYSLAVKEYHRDRAADNAVKAGALTERIPREEPPPMPEPSEEDIARADREIRGLPPAPTPEEAMRAADAIPLASSAPEPIERRFELARDEHGPRIVERGLPESRLDRIEDRLAALEKLGGEILAALDYRVTSRLNAVLDSLYPEPIDWDALYAQADHATERD